MILLILRHYHTELNSLSPSNGGHPCSGGGGPCNALCARIGMTINLPAHPMSIVTECNKQCPQSKGLSIAERGRSSVADI